MGVIVTTLAAVALSLLGRELWCYQPRMQKWLLRIAVRQLPADMRERYLEEWSALLEAYPGELTRDLVALAQIYSACAIASEARNTTLGAEAVRRLLDIFVFGPAVALIGLLLSPSLLLVPQLLRKRKIHFSDMSFVGLDGRQCSWRLLYETRMAGSNSVLATLATLGHDLFQVALGLVRGDVSFIGPDARRSEELALLGEDQVLYLRTRPGITSPGLNLWSRMSPAERATPEGKQRVANADIEFMKRRSLRSDFALFWKTPLEDIASVSAPSLRRVRASVRRLFGR